MSVYTGQNITFERVITAPFELASGGTVGITLAKFGFWGTGNYAITTIVSKAEPAAAGVLRNANIAGGNQTLKDSWLLPGASGGLSSGDDTIALAAGLWEVTFYLTLVVDPDPAQVDLVGGQVKTATPYMQATITDGSTTYIEDWVVPCLPAIEE